jgi:hypothetical protein
MGDGTLMFRDNMDSIYRSGHKISYTPVKLDIDKNINVKSFFCGNSFFCIISGIFL